MSQRCSSEEHHATQPARPQSSACRRNDAALGPTGRPPGATATWGGREGGTEEGCILPGEIQEQRPGTGRDSVPNTAGPEGTGSTDDVLVTSLKREYWWCCLAVFPFKTTHILKGDGAGEMRPLVTLVLSGPRRPTVPTGSQAPARMGRGRARALLPEATPFSPQIQDPCDGQSKD